MAGRYSVTGGTKSTALASTNSETSRRSRDEAEEGAAKAALATAERVSTLLSEKIFYRSRGRERGVDELRDVEVIPLS